MKIELKNVKYAQFASEETSCFQATLHIDGVKRGVVSNDGRGACNFYTDRTVSAELDAYGKTLPPVKVPVDGKGKFFDLTQSADTLVGELLDDFLLRRDMKRSLSKRILFTRTDKAGIFQTSILKDADKNRVYADPKKYFPNMAQILNILPEDQALALYKSAQAS